MNAVLSQSANACKDVGGITRELFIRTGKHDRQTCIKQARHLSAGGVKLEGNVDGGLASCW